MDRVRLHSFQTVKIPIKINTRTSNFFPSHESGFMAIFAEKEKLIVPSIMEVGMCLNHVPRTMPCVEHQKMGGIHVFGLKVRMLRRTSLCPSWRMTAPIFGHKCRSGGGGPSLDDDTPPSDHALDMGHLSLTCMA